MRTCIAILFVSSLFGQAPTITTTTLPNGYVGTAYSQTIVTTGVPTPTCSVTAGSLPAGLALSSGCVLSGTPTRMELQPFTVTAANGTSPDDTQAFTLVIAGPGTNGLGGSSFTCVDRDGDGYGVGPKAEGPYASDLTIEPIPWYSPPPAPTVTAVGTTGATTFYYFVASCRKTSSSFPCTTPSPAGVVTDSHNSTFSASDYNHVTWPDQSLAVGYGFYLILRSTSATIPSGTGQSPLGGLVTGSCSAGTCSFDDDDPLQRTSTTPIGSSVFISSASRPFTDDDLGLAINITAGTGFLANSDYTVCGTENYGNTQCAATGVAGVVAVGFTTGSSVVSLGVQGATGGSWRVDGCTGPDADDQDATVYSWPQAKAKYGSFSAFLARPNGPGYAPSNIWYLAPTTPTAACLANLASGESTASCTGNNATGAVNDPTKPYATFAAFRTSVVADHMVVMRAGVNDYVTPNGNGSSGSPMIFYGHPGELPVFDFGRGVAHYINLQARSWIVVDGVRGQNGGCINAGDSSGYITPHDFHDVVLRHIEGVSCAQGIGPIAGYDNLLIEDSNFHNNNIGSQQAGLYIGGRYVVATNATLQRILTYNNVWNGSHTNGPNSGTVVRQCVSYNNGLAGFSSQSGGSGAVWESNLSFGNLANSFEIYSYQNGFAGENYPAASATWAGGIATVTLTTAGSVALDTLPGGSSTYPHTSTGMYVDGMTPVGYNCPIYGCTLLSVSNRTVTYAVASDPGGSGSGGTAYFGSGDQTNILLQNNTFIARSVSSGIVVSSTENGTALPVVGNLGGNTYRNNIVLGNSASATYAPIYFKNTEAGHQYLPSSTLDHGLTWNSGAGSVQTIMQKSGASFYLYSTAGNPTNGGPSISWTAPSPASMTFANPQFVSYSNSAFPVPLTYDFRLQSTSPAKFAGTAAGSPTVYDLYGNPFGASPSIGAIEFQGVSGGSRPTMSGAVLTGAKVRR